MISASQRMSMTQPAAKASGSPAAADAPPAVAPARSVPVDGSPFARLCFARPGARGKPWRCSRLQEDDADGSCAPPASVARTCADPAVGLLCTGRGRGRPVHGLPLCTARHPMPSRPCRRRPQRRTSLEPPAVGGSLGPAGAEARPASESARTSPPSRCPGSAAASELPERTRAKPRRRSRACRAQRAPAPAQTRQRSDARLWRTPPYGLLALASPDAACVRAPHEAFHSGGCLSVQARSRARGSPTAPSHANEHDPPPPAQTRRVSARSQPSPVLARLDVLHLRLGLFPRRPVPFRPLDVAPCERDLDASEMLSARPGPRARVRGNGRSRTMYRLRSSSFSCWNRFRSFRTPALASLTSFSATSRACSSCEAADRVSPRRNLNRLPRGGDSPAPDSPSSSQSGPSSSSPGPRPRSRGSRG